MITAPKLKVLTSFTPVGLEAALFHSGYKDAKIEKATFVGLSNGNQFAYTISFKEDDRVRTGKVFLTYDAVEDRITADY